MKFHYLSATLLVLFFVFVPGYTLIGQQQNGGIINLAGDTIACSIVSNPRDAGLKRQAGMAYTYDYAVAVFNNDSVRILYPGSIKGFYARWPETNTLETSWYISDSINRTHDMLFKKPKAMRPVFLQRLVTGGYYHLWYFEQADPGSRNDRVFLLEECSTERRRYFNSTRQLRKLLGNWPEKNKNNPVYKEWFKGKQLMVSEYNRYKAGK